MFFLLRLLFWLGGVCVLLPSNSTTATPDSGISAGQAVSIAGAAVTDMRGFCARQPDACKAGGKVAVAIGHKAEAGARTIFDFVTAKLAKRPAEKTTKVATVRPGGEIEAHGTLTSADLVPAWHAAVPLPPRRETRASRPAV
jgi:hypothetical protein